MLSRVTARITLRRQSALAARARTALARLLVPASSSSTILRGTSAAAASTSLNFSSKNFSTMSEASPVAAHVNPPGLRWDLTSAEIKSESERIMSDATAVLDRIGALAGAPDAAITFDAVVAPLITLDRDTEAREASVTFVKNVAASKDVRDAAAAAQAELAAFAVKAGMRLDVYTAFSRYAALAAASGELARLHPEFARFVERSMRDFKRRGLHLEEGTRRKVEALQTKMSALSVAYSKNLGEDATKLYFTEEQLNGLPADFVGSLKQVSARVALGLEASPADDGSPAPASATIAAGNAAAVRAFLEKSGGAAGAEASDVKFREVTLSYPHVVPLLKLAKEPATRAAVEKAFNSRAVPANVDILEELVTLRRYHAQLLGFPSHAAYVLEERMAASVDTVTSFLGELGRDLKPLHQADLASLTALKRGEQGAAAGPLSMADYRYYQEQELRAKFSVDHDALKAYFPLKEVVLPSILRVYETLMHIAFVQQPAGAVKAWHEEAILYHVYDRRHAAGAGAGAGGAAASSGAGAAGEAGHGRLLGYLYLDLHPREGKYNHAAVFPLVSGCDAGTPRADGSGEGRVLPVCAMVCNFPKAMGDKPALLPHGDAVTLGHELGHVLHHLLSNTKTKRFSSFAVEGDYVEAPSQMLENWWYEPATLRSMSGRWDNLEAKLPAEDAAKLQASKVAHAGLLNTRQVFLATLDQRLHALPAVAPPEALFDALAAEAAAAAGGAGNEKAAAGGAGEGKASGVVLASAAERIDIGALLRDLHDQILGIPMTEGSNFAASFGHLAGGYDASYYGYLWSEVYAADMFETAFRANPLSPEAGARYRDTILAPGGSEDAAVFTRRFLGREPSNKAFLRSKGLKA